MLNSGRPDIRKTRRKLSVLLLVASTAILAGGFFYYRNYRSDLLQNTESLLRSVTSFKTDQLLEWRNDRLQRAASLLDSPVLSVHLNKLAANHNDLQTADLLRRRLGSFLRNNPYKSAVLATPDGRMLVKAGRPPQRLCPDALELLKRAPRSPEMSDLHEQPDTGITYGIHVVGLAGTSPGGARIFLILGIDPNDHLYPLVQKWPGPSRTAETLLIRREGDQVLFLNELRHAKGTPLKLRLPLSPELPAAMAATGRRGLIRGVDYRGKDVFAYLSQLPEFGWAMVTKVDASEILEDSDRTSALLLLLVMALLAASATGTFLFLRLQEESYSKLIATTDAKLKETEQIFREFMEHSPIYVFFKDENLRSLNLSRNFEKMLGKPLQELLGKNMNELFPSDLAQKIVADDLKILREGKETSIEEDFNGRHYVTTKFPIKPEGKPAYLAGYTIDVTEQKRNENINAARIRLLDFAASHTLEELLEATLNEAEKLSGSSICFCHFLEGDQETLSLQNWSARTKAEFCKAEGKGRHYPVSEAGVWTDCIRERKPVIHNDYASLPHRKGLPPGHPPVTRELVVPVFRGERIVAILGVGNKPSNYDQTDVALISLFADLAWDISERKRGEEALRASEQRHKSLFEKNSSVFLLIDPATGVILDANPAACAYYGWQEEDLKGMNISQINTLSPEEIGEEMRRATLEKCNHFFFRHRTANGAVRDVEVFSSPIKLGGKTLLFSIIHDITDRKTAEKRTEQLNKELAAKNQEMENFLYITTHDLRSPLVNIQGFSQNLRHYQEELGALLRRLTTGLTPEDEARLKELTMVKVPEALEFVLGSSRKMDALITALLKVSRIGRVEMKPEKLEMGELLRKVLDAMRFQLEESGAVVKTGALPPCRADQGAVSQVFTNLLDNAVKYRDTSRALKIEVSGEVRGDSAFYKVADNGPGISEKDLDRIWNVFYRHERTADRGGEGIGLPMVRRIIERNGGNITAESQEGKGTVFYVQLPAVREG